MRIPLLLLLCSISLILFLDGYIYAALRRRLPTVGPARVQLIISLILYVVLIVALLLPARSGSSSMLLSKMWILFSISTIYLSKALFVMLDLLARAITKLLRKHRPQWLTPAAAAIALAFLLALWWGALINRFDIDTRRVDIDIANLPTAFDGYTIVQISDLHLGTYGNDTSYIDRLVDHVNNLEPDLIVFTGDIVNRSTDELPPFVATLSRLHAPDGVYSILGNHDYGDYIEWPSDEAKSQSLQQLCSLQQQMGWNLLRNEHRTIKIGRDSIAIIGVENIGDPPFKSYGDLRIAYPELADSTVKILLSHNPAHWQMEIADRQDVNIALTLSGHTHAMQIAIGNISPASWRYDHWSGLYSDRSNNHALYVNIGIGTVGLPMRLGATPEVTIFTLHPKSSSPAHD